MQTLFSSTSSRGNCTVLKSSDGHLLTIDCGIPYETVNRSIGYQLHECKVLLCTHKHSDHVKFINDFRNRGMIACCDSETAVSSKIVGRYCGLHDRIEGWGNGFRWIPIALHHTNSDGSECPCFGFLIKDNASGEMLLHCTDTQYIKYRFPPINIINIECNYTEQDSYMEDLEAIERAVEMRRVRSHLSLQSCTSFLAKQDLSKCKEVRLLHISDSMTKSEKDNLIPFIRERTGRHDLNVVF